MRNSSIFALMMAAGAVAARGHDGKPHRYEDLWVTWSFDPLVITVLAISGAAYLIGSVRVWRSSGYGHGISRNEALMFWTGWAAMFIALVSPLHPWGEVLFSAHMTQHEILMLVAAPLIILGRPFIAGMWALPGNAAKLAGRTVKHRQVRRIWNSISNAPAAWLIHAVALWIWHIPYLFEATLKSDAVHTLQHASFFLSALLFWWAILFGRKGLKSYGAGVLYLFTTMMHSGLLGVFLTLTTRVLYPSYAETAPSWGLSPIEDQQLGGLIMWIPAGIVYIFAALIMFASWLRESEAAVVKREQRRVAERAV